MLCIPFLCKQRHLLQKLKGCEETSHIMSFSLSLSLQTGYLSLNDNFDLFLCIKYGGSMMIKLVTKEQRVCILFLCVTEIGLATFLPLSVPWYLLRTLLFSQGGVSYIKIQNGF